ncbi:MAG: HPF/RaiA family ribosome-associated protein [Candidatus Sungbacteria bacterium]|nr:HPF/RaiA family ribosome-associated protein [Candidatus Sungbacteria bacterium]
MRYQIRYTKVDPSPALTDYIEKKIVDALQRLIGGTGETPWQILIEVGRDTLHHKKGNVWFAEVSGAGPYGPLRVRAEGSDIHEAIDIAEDDLKANLSKLKGRIVAKGLRAARRVKRIMRLSRFARFFRKGRIREEGI